MGLGTMSGPFGLVEIDGKPVGGKAGAVGPVTLRLQALYGEAMVKDENLFDVFTAATSGSDAGADDAAAVSAPAVASPQGSRPLAWASMVPALAVAVAAGVLIGRRSL